MYRVHAQAQKEPHMRISLKLFEYLLSIQRGYEDMEQRYNALQQQEFLRTEATTYQLELMCEQELYLLSKADEDNSSMM